MAQKYRLVDVSSGWPTIDPGKMRHEVTVQQYGPTSPQSYDAAGPALIWSTFTTALAAIETVHGTDTTQSGQVTTQLFLTVAMWFEPGIAPNMRVVSDNGSTYVIKSIENTLEMNIVLVLNCVGLGPND